MYDYWLKQTVDQPLFADLLWSRPEHKAQAGKLLIVGGNTHGFAAVGEAYTEASKAGIGVARALLPSSLQKTVGRIFEAGEYAPSTPSGSFNRQAQAELRAMDAWSDGTLLAGDFGRNSETAIVLEQFLHATQGQVTLTKDTVDYFIHEPYAVIDRPSTLIVLSFAQLQKLASKARSTYAFTFDMNMLQLVAALHDFTNDHQSAIIVKHLETIFVANGGQVSTTKLAQDLPIWRVKIAAHASVWWLQNPSKTFESLTTSIVSAVA